MPTLTYDQFEALKKSHEEAFFSDDDTALTAVQKADSLLTPLLNTGAIDVEYILRMEATWWEKDITDAVKMPYFSMCLFIEKKPIPTECWVKYPYQLYVGQFLAELATKCPEQMPTIGMFDLPD